METEISNTKLITRISSTERANEANSTELVARHSCMKQICQNISTKKWKP